MQNTFPVPLTRAQLLLVLRDMRDKAPGTWAATSYYAAMEPAMRFHGIAPRDVVESGVSAK